ncbi:hypothetical protein FOA52_009535, partial [Chlamydomonas sp. UWO 241]
MINRSTVLLLGPRSAAPVYLTNKDLASALPLAQGLARGINRADQGYG